MRRHCMQCTRRSCTAFPLQLRTVRHCRTTDRKHRKGPKCHGKTKTRVDNMASHTPKTTACIVSGNCGRTPAGGFGTNQIRQRLQGCLGSNIRLHAHRQTIRDLSVTTQDRHGTQGERSTSLNGLVLHDSTIAHHIGDMPAESIARAGRSRAHGMWRSDRCWDRKVRASDAKRDHGTQKRTQCCKG